MTVVLDESVRRSRAHQDFNSRLRHSDVSCTRDEFVASMMKSHGAWIGPVITRWLDTDTPHTPSWGLTDAEILRARGVAVDDAEGREAVA